MADIREKIYEEVGANYRFFLGWRHAAFAGYLVVVGATISLTASTYNDSPGLAFLVPLGAFPIGLLLCVIDRRNRSLYSAVQRVGASLERPAKGSYARITEVAAPEGLSPWRLA